MNDEKRQSKITKLFLRITKMASPRLLAKIHRIITFYIIAHVYYQNKEQQQYQSYVDIIQCYTFENISG